MSSSITTTTTTKSSSGTFLSKVVSVLNTPTSKVGIVAILTMVSSALAGTVSWPHAITAIVGSIVLIIVPDNSVAASDVEQLVADAINAAVAIKTTSTVIVPGSVIVPVTPTTTVSGVTL